MSSRCTLQVLIPDPITGRILIAFHGPSRAWTLPAGDLLKGEDMAAAAHRVVADAVSVGVQIGWVADIAIEPVGIRVLIPGRHVTGRPAAIGDFIRCAWVDNEDLRQLLPAQQLHQIARTSQRPTSFSEGCRPERAGSAS